VRKSPELLDISAFSWYNNSMKSEADNTDTVTISREEYEDLQEKKRLYQWITEQLRVNRKKAFGSSSEKATEGVYEQLSLLFNETEAIAQEESISKIADIPVRSYTRKRKTGSVHDILPRDAEVVEIEHTLSEEERTCPECGSVMEPIGKEVVEKVVLVPAKAVLQRDVYYTYACKQCTAEPTPITKAPKEPALIPGSYASAEAVAQLAVQKFVMGVPLYRQEQAWNRQNVLLSRQTMSNWLLRCTEDWFSPVYEELHKRLLRHDLLHADETELQVLHEDGKTPQSKSYMWLYRTSGDAGHPIILYEYCPSRGQEHPKRFLNGFHGYLQTDGYSGYNGIPDIHHIGCWAHARRKFEEARQAVPKGEQPTTAEQGVAYCTKLFQLEEQFKGLSPEERNQKRLEQEKPILDAMSAWAKTRNAAPKSKLGIALTYLLNQWDALTAYLLDGRIELSNNRAERSIKPFVISRKNFLFANTPSGAQSSAILFSLIETAKENGLDPYRYLVWVLKEAPNRFNTDRAWATSLLPQFAPSACKTNTAEVSMNN
jgi:Transposase and inactivated derivatives